MKNKKIQSFISKHIKLGLVSVLFTWDLLVPAVDLSSATLLASFLNMAK